ncbi:hypothetical protein [Chitinophaga sp.]|uniref:hypothetical protein n=1 Tax=Chitinophaga sp. TaxID=1869181 RepID=UPI0031D469C5
MIRRNRKISLAISLFLMGTINAFACSCQGEGSVPQNMKRSDAVFSGQVISFTLTTNYDSLRIVVTGDTSSLDMNWRQIPIAVVKIKVDKMYKGKHASDTLTILTPSTSAACGVRFQTGRKYIVYARASDELPLVPRRRSLDKRTFWTHLCTRTQGWNTLEEKEILKQYV